MQESFWLEVGTIVAPQGLNGEVRVYPNSDFPERFEKPGQRWLLQPGETEPQPYGLLEGRYIPSKGIYVLKFAGVENCNQAEALRGCLLMVSQNDRPTLREDEYYVPDLIGLEVFNQLSGEIVGIVVDVVSAGNDLLVVSCQKSLAENLEPGLLTKDKEVLIPFVKAIVPVVDRQLGRIEITPPPGLLELS
ncbi:MAG: ribosome maturation factor RimM [Chamaesiphon sp.]